MKIVFASNNEHKLTEIRQLLPNGYELLSLSDIQCTEELSETGHTLKDNAHQKAYYVFEKYGFDCFADDTGLEVEDLNGEPGVYSARYAGEERSAEKNMQKLLFELGDSGNRKAHFKTVICLILKGKSYFFEGTVDGTILHEKRGEKGFGYDPVFLPDGYTKSFAELPAEEKNKISHRARAVEKLVAFLRKQPSTNMN